MEKTKSDIKQSMFVGKTEGSFREKYRVGKIIGQGAFGEVRICIHRESGGRRCLKVLKKKKLSDVEQRMLYTEISILKGLDHPGVVRLFEFFEDETRLYLITDLCQGGELFSELQESGAFSEMIVVKIIKQVLSCVNYLHSKDIAHRDLKLENILLEVPKNFDSVKIIDFGTAHEITGEFMTEIVGTPYYIAPEVFGKKYTKACDLWSIGVITYILLSNSPPFNAATDQEVVDFVKAGKYTFDAPVWETVSASAKDFISQLLQLDPSARPSAQAAFEHAWIQSCQAEVNGQDAFAALANLKDYRADQTLKAVAYTYITAQLTTKTERDNLAQIFRAFDKNGDGKLSIEEVKSGYRDYYGQVLKDSEVQKIFNSVDTDGSGFIDYSEFVSANFRAKQVTANEKLLAAFKFFDKNNKGSLSYEEIQAVMGFGGELDKKTIDKMIKEVDTDGDGEISFEEFSKMMRSIGT